MLLFFGILCLLIGVGLAGVLIQGVVRGKRKKIIHEGEILITPATALLADTFEHRTFSPDEEAVSLRIQVQPPIPSKVREYFSGTEDERILYIRIPDNKGEFNIHAWIDGRKVLDKGEDIL